MRLVRGLLALLLLLVVLVGIPAVLWHVGAPFPSGSPGELVDRLLRPDDGTLLLAALTLVGWVAWGSFALAVLLDVPAHMRGLPAPRVPGLTLQQRAASVLVGAVVALVVGGVAAGPAAATDVGPRAGGASAPPPASAPTEVPVGGGDRGDDAVPAGATGAPDAAVQSALAVTVQRGDSLWSLAERHLGDGHRWRDLAEANLGTPQPGGGSLGADGALQPGWRILVPGEPAEGTRGVASDVRHVVSPGDTLSGIAARHLGDADRWPELAEASADTLQPDGRRLVDPDLIVPGWTVTVPAVPAVPAVPPPPTGPPAEPPPDPRAEPGPEAPSGDAGDAAAVTDADDPPGSWGALADAGEESDATADPPAGPTDGPAAGTVLDDPDADTVDLATPAGIGGLLAAAAVTVLAVRRRDAREDRAVGERLTPPEPPHQLLEQQLRAVAAGTRTSELDRALEDLRRRLAARGLLLPAVRAARLTREDLELYLVEPADLPAPWVCLDERTVWSVAFADVDTETPARRLVEELGLDLLTGAASPPPEPSDLPPLLPGLVCLGSDDDDGLVLLDLERVGVLEVVGSAAGSRAVLGALAAELAMGRSRDTVEVLLVGSGREVVDAVPGGAVRHVERVEHVLTELAARADDVERVLAAAGVDSVAAARAADRAHEAWDCQVVLIGDPDDVARHEQSLAALVPRLSRAGICLVLAGPPDVAARDGRWRLRLDDSASAAVEEGSSGWGVLEPAGVALRPQRLVLEDARRLAALQAPTATMRGPAWGRRLGSGPPPSVDAPLPSSREVAAPVAPPRLPTRDDLVGGDVPVVQLLGTVQVHGARGPAPASHTARATALLAYLASSDGPRTRTQVAEALSPTRRLTEQTVHALASRTRRWLGDDEEGRPYLPRAVDSGSYSVHADVTTDWERWQALLGPDVTSSPVEVLVAALELVDAPFAGVVERHYTWAEPLREDILAGVVDVAHEAARRALVADRPDLARRAARAGMRVDSAAEVLWRDLLRAEHAAGRPVAVAELAERLRAYADDLGVDLQPETEALVGEIVPVRTGRRARRHRAVTP
ncbi:LysM peptidoglycan-binding domain-containing protein [Aquipuribacter nitratireducens]|uniref:LysM peptidoglycan-binding domain-containing protein n=1 Tax=Aquipuribacter nitratireducens TaxID=650104 RepID=A0ABW0GRE1_9MICO